MTPALSQESQVPAAPGTGEYSHPAGSGRFVRQFRQIVLLPLELVPLEGRAHIQRRDWDMLTAPADGSRSRWRELGHAFPREQSPVSEGLYREFDAFLPHVRRFLYVRGKGKGTDGPVSSTRVFRRRDIAEVRIALDERTKPLMLRTDHVDLHVFSDVNAAVLAIEIDGADMDLDLVQEVMYRFGRVYPPGWSEAGIASYCPRRVEWLDGAGGVLAVSDYEQRETFLKCVCRHQVPAMAAHWEFALSPLIASHNEHEGPLRYRLVAGNRMPLLAFLALDDPHGLTPNDYVRLGLALAPGDPSASPYGPAFLKDFEKLYCYDRFHDPTRADGWIDTRIVCCGYAFVTIGDARLPLFTDPERGVLALFRHQLFLIGLIAHFHRAMLLTLFDRFVRTINRVDVERPETIPLFRRDLRQTIETFLCFSHRYWFSEISDQAVPRDLFRMWSGHLGTHQLYAEVNGELERMSHYLDSVMVRRTTGTIVRLTVVAILSLIGTATTGFLGMNLIDETETPLALKALYFAVVAGLTLALTVYTIMKSHRLAEFHDVLADERLSWRTKVRAFFAVWR